MLVLTRNIGESIVIQDNIVISILGVDRGQVKVGIEAPREIPVHRIEVHRKIQAEKEANLGSNEGRESYGIEEIKQWECPPHAHVSTEED